MKRFNSPPSLVNRSFESYSILFKINSLNALRHWGVISVELHYFWTKLFLRLQIRYLFDIRVSQQSPIGNLEIEPVYIVVFEVGTTETSQDLNLLTITGQIDSSLSGPSHSLPSLSLLLYIFHYFWWFDFLSYIIRYTSYVTIYFFFLLSIPETFGSESSFNILRLVKIVFFFKLYYFNISFI